MVTPRGVCCTMGAPRLPSLNPWPPRNVRAIVLRRSVEGPVSAPSRFNSILGAAWAGAAAASRAAPAKIDLVNTPVSVRRGAEPCRRFRAARPGNARSQRAGRARRRRPSAAALSARLTSSSRCASTRPTPASARTRTRTSTLAHPRADCRFEPCSGSATSWHARTGHTERRERARARAGRRRGRTRPAPGRRTAAVTRASRLSSARKPRPVRARCGVRGLSTTFKGAAFGRAGRSSPSRQWAALASGFRGQNRPIGTAPKTPSRPPV